MLVGDDLYGGQRASRGRERVVGVKPGSTVSLSS
jgi:hypothetical protein